MKRLILMRHAKSDWSATGDDHARPLNKRGKISAPAMGDWLRAKGWMPEGVLCSSATRTRQTLDLLGFEDVTTRFERALYLAEASDMVGVLQTAEADTVLMLGHNYGIAQCAHLLVQKWPDHPRFLDYPTCATSLISFPFDTWEEAGSVRGTCEDFAIPREVLAASAAT